MSFKRRIIDELETVGGRHDEPEIYSGAPGDPGLAGGPGSMSWEINGDLASLVVGGSSAIIMEVLHPSVMAGVFEQSSYRTEPIQRAQNTLGYVLRTTFGTTAAATRVIERVKKVHSHINGTRPDGVPYRALDPELIAWVHTCIPWAVMNAFDRYRRPLTTAEKDRYLTEQAVIGRMGGAEWVPETTAELDDYVAQMKPKLSMNEQTRSFIDFLAGDTGGPDAASTAQAGRGTAGAPGLDEPHARLGPAPHQHLPPRARPTALLRPGQPAAGRGRALGLPRAAVQAAGPRAMRCRHHRGGGCHAGGGRQLTPGGLPPLTC